MFFRKIGLVLLIAWWGAFMFYTGIVIPVGMRILGNHTKMGFITQEVTNYLNYFSLPIFLFITYTFNDKKLFFRLGVLLVFLQIFLFYLHNKLFYLLDFHTLVVKQKTFFYSLHRLYLLVSTLIWLIVSILIGFEITKKYP